MPRAATVLIVLLLAGCGQDDAAAASDRAAFNIDPARITVSGVSSGAYMAGQLHLAHSAVFSGVAMVAGGPYACAMGDIKRALGPCLKGGDIDRKGLLEHAAHAAASGAIDDLGNLNGDSVWIFHGELDDVVSADLSNAAAQMYATWMPDSQVTVVLDVASVHGLPTLATGSPCDVFAPPFLNACDYDTAGNLLSALLGVLRDRVTAVTPLQTLEQPGYADAGMMQHAFLYVPTSCADGELCGIHVALHGCSQSAEVIDDAFASGAGLNEWADTNDLLVLYPQVSSSKIAPVNPYGCWDWWGYSGANYAVQTGAQIAAIKSMLDQLAGAEL